MADERKEIDRLGCTGEDLDDGVSEIPADGPSQRDPEAPSIEDRILEIAKTVPEEVWDKLPADLSQRVDYYLYGIDDS